MNYQNNASNVCRDVQMLIGEKSVETCRFVDDTFFNIFCCSGYYRLSALSSLSKLTILTLNNCLLQLRSPNGKYSLLIDLSKDIGYLYLGRLVNLVVNHFGFWIKELYVVSLKFIEFDKLMGSIESLKDVTVLSLPYEFGNRRSKKMERFIQNNANTLLALKHLTLPVGIPREMRERLIAVHTSTLRNGTLEREQDFYAFYTSGASFPSVLEPLPKTGVVLRIELHRLNEPFRAAKRAFISHGSMDLLSRIVILKFTSIILSVLDNPSVQKLLNKLTDAQHVFPKLTILEVELKLLDAYPNNYSLITDLDDRENDVVSPMALDSIRLADLLITWINSNTFSFKVFAKVCLSVDYVISENEDKNEMLEKAMRETNLSLTGTQWENIQWKFDGNNCLASKQIEINEQTKFEYLLDYRSSIYSEKSCDSNILFNIGHSL